MERIPVAGPSITDKEISYVTDAVTRCWYGNAGLYHQKFQQAFAAYLGVKHAIALPSCTSAIHLALAALGIGAGDEVIVPDSTWIATSAPITYVGATAVFADVDERTWCLSAQSLTRCFTARTKAVISVDLYGGMPDYDAITRLCRERSVALIEDAAEAIGSQVGARRAGALGDVGVFSFHGSKTLTTGEGGMLVTDRDDLFRRVSVLMDHGRRPGDRLFFNDEIAFKYKMSSMQAALGLAQLERIEELIVRKREIFSWYQRYLAGVDGVALNAESPGTRNSYWMVTIVLDTRHQLPKLRLMELLDEKGIDTRPFFFPLSSLPAYRHLGGEETWRARNPTAYRLGDGGLNLPSALSLTQDQVKRVCQAVKDCLRDLRS